MNLTDKDKNILTVVKDHGPITPSQIGMKLGRTAQNASAYVAPALKKLREAKLVKRTTKKREPGEMGAPFVLYTATNKEI